MEPGHPFLRHAEPIDITEGSLPHESGGIRDGSETDHKLYLDLILTFLRTTKTRPPDHH